MNETDPDTSTSADPWVFDYIGILLEVVLLRKGLRLRIDLGELSLKRDQPIMVVTFLHDVDSSDEHILNSLNSGIGEEVHIQAGHMMASRTVDFSFKPDNADISCLPSEMKLEYVSYSIDDLHEKAARLSEACRAAVRQSSVYEREKSFYKSAMEDLRGMIEDGIKRARAEYDIQNGVSSVRAAELRGRFLAYEYLKHYLESSQKT